MFGVPAAQASEPSCETFEIGYRIVSVAQGPDTWTYEVTVSGPNWRTQPYGYHATGLLICDNCDRHKVRSLFYLFTAADSAKTKHLRSAEERLERRDEFYGGFYPYVRLGEGSLEPHSARENLRLDGLSGYAVVFRLTQTAMNHLARAYTDFDRERDGLLVISLNDGCVYFGTNFRVSLANENSIWRSLDSLLRELAIVKTRSKSKPMPDSKIVTRPDGPDG